MQKLISIIALAIAVLAGYKKTIAAQKTRIEELENQVATRDAVISDQADTIEELKETVANDSVDDAALEEAAKDARLAADQSAKEAAESKAKADDLQKQIDEANTKGEELSVALTENDQTPNVDSDFNLVGTAPAGEAVEPKKVTQDPMGGNEPPKDLPSRGDRALEAAAANASTELAGGLKPGAEAAAEPPTPPAEPVQPAPGEMPKK